MEDNLRIKIQLPDVEYWEPISGALHVCAALASLYGLVYLSYLTGQHQAFRYFVVNAIFMASMLFLYTASAVYHIVPLLKGAKDFFRRLDHAMIFVLIAGSFTPIYVMSSMPSGVPYFLITMWAIALIGIVVKMFNIYLPQKYSTLIYLGMGWCGVLLLKPLRQFFGDTGLYLFMGGGISYTLGAGLYMLEDRYDPQSDGWYHEIFHIFTMVGSFCHYWMMQDYFLHH